MKLRRLEIRDSVLLDKSNKFKRAPQGPFTIIQKCSDVVCKIQSQEDPSNMQKVHLNRLLKIPKRKQHLIDSNLEKNNTTNKINTSQINDTSSAASDKTQEEKNNSANRKKEKQESKSKETPKYRYNLRKIKGRD